MSIHVFGAIVTSHGTAANNRGLTEGNITTLQKVVWNGQVHTTVSAESVRFALRRRLADSEACNRTWNEDQRGNEWKDAKFERWSKPKETPFIDDDLLGFMQAEGASEEGGKGTVKARRAVLELTRAISLTPWPGDMTFNAASPGATPSAAKKGEKNPVPYGTEMHATRYQYGFALTPEKLRVPGRARTALEALCALGEVAGNQGRFLFDFSPDSVVFRITQDPAPRILYSFAVNGNAVALPELMRRVNAGDIPPAELIIGGSVVSTLDKESRKLLEGAVLLEGVRAACQAACKRLEGKRS